MLGAIPENILKTSQVKDEIDFEIEIELTLTLKLKLTISTNRIETKNIKLSFHSNFFFILSLLSQVNNPINSIRVNPGF